MQIYKIEDVAKECGLTKRAIRYYEEIGLLPPPERSAGGYRLYSDKHIERLKQIINARDVLGVSLQELQEYLSIIEAIRQQRQGIHDAVDKETKREKLEELEDMTGKMLGVIDQRLEKLNGLRTDVVQLLGRIRTAKTDNIHTTDQE
ncbi:MerR family transcriptional regulator [Cohnella caldifontis]|uniref:MerR family transcriptional regulator n=1 Tax=Cohnella caldifontis TaxID=3027471 RepID=UPI0023EAF000|nr:MerR family transcriptional regulator [Cohnella sp. YIM B05605]